MENNKYEQIIDASLVSGGRLPVIKSLFIGRDGTEESNVIQTTPSTMDLFRGTGAIAPPLDLGELAALPELSGALRTNIDVYATNVDGFGHRFEPVVDIEDDDTFEVVRQAMMEEKLHEQLVESEGDGEDGENGTAKKVKAMSMLERIIKLNTPPGTSPAGDTPQDQAELNGLNVDVSDDEVKAKIEELRRIMVWEEQLLNTFFDFCCPKMAFTKLRAISRQDLETTGNSYWEVIRNTNGEPVQFEYVPAFTVRLMPVDKDAIVVPMPIPRTILRVEEELVRCRFRKFVQVIEGGAKTRIWFKEFGDPRCYSSATGEEYKDLKELEKVEPGVNDATELFHFKIHSARSPYGIPRWVSELLAVMGNRHAEEINLAYFENKSIPPMVIMVSGGSLAKDETERIKDFMKNEIRGKRNFHKIMILQAESSGRNLTGQNSGTVKIEIKPLQQFQNDDGLFMKYQEANGDRIGSVFRNPRLLRGDVRDFNRATAEASLAFAENQVYAPLRKDFDWQMNRFILPSLGVRMWKFVSKGPDTTDVTEIGDLLNKAAENGYLNMRELREIAAKVFGRKFKAVDDKESTEIPLELLRLGIAENEADDGADLPEDASEDTPEQAQKRYRRKRRARSALKLADMEEHFRHRERKDAAEAYARQQEAKNAE